eukprot:UN27011
MRHYDNQTISVINSYDPLTETSEGIFKDCMNGTITDDHPLPVKIFAPKACQPVNRISDSNKKYNPGVENIPILLETGDTVYFNSTTRTFCHTQPLSKHKTNVEKNGHNVKYTHLNFFVHTLTFFKSWHMVQESWSLNIQQAKVVNLDLSSILYFWGSACRHSAVVRVRITIILFFKFATAWFSKQMIFWRDADLQ